MVRSCCSVKSRAHPPIIVYVFMQHCSAHPSLLILRLVVTSDVANILDWKDVTNKHPLDQIVFGFDVLMHTTSNAGGNFLPEPGNHFFDFTIRAASWAKLEDPDFYWKAGIAAHRELKAVALPKMRAGVNNPAQLLPVSESLLKLVGDGADSVHVTAVKLREKPFFPKEQEQGAPPDKIIARFVRRSETPAPFPRFSFAKAITGENTFCSAVKTNMIEQSFPSLRRSPPPSSVSEDQGRSRCVAEVNAEADDHVTPWSIETVALELRSVVSQDHGQAVFV